MAHRDCKSRGYGHERFESSYAHMDHVNENMTGIRGVRLSTSVEAVDVIYSSPDMARAVIVTGGFDVHLHPSGQWILYRVETGGLWRLSRIPADASDVGVVPAE